MNLVGSICNKRISTFLSLNYSKRKLHGECLNNRGLIKVCGNEAGDFLQGLITNDIEHLNIDGAISSMYSMFLNVQGRVLFDSILYKTNEHTYVIDCDSQVTEPLINHMKLYKVRRKISFEKIENLKVWVIYDNDLDLKQIDYLSPKSKVIPYLNDSNLPSETIITRDPRLQYLGDRILTPTQTLQDYSNFTLLDGGFEKFKYRLGIGEGVNDLPRGKCLPLESNCDYLHGVSFQKGCYIGQELTARTYHTGVIRKRVMPLIFENKNIVEKNSIITNEKGKNVGKVINSAGHLGIGLVRVKEALESQRLNVGQIKVETFRPGWWPIEVSKEKQV